MQRKIERESEDAHTIIANLDLDLIQHKQQQKPHI